MSQAIKKPRIHPIPGEALPDTARRMADNLRAIFQWYADQEEILLINGIADPRLDPEFIAWWRSHPPLASENWADE